jgi:hypothetical protein
MLDFLISMLSHQLFGTSKYFHFEKGFRESQEFCCALILSPWGHAKANYKENEASCNLRVWVALLLNICMCLWPIWANQIIGVHQSQTSFWHLSTKLCGHSSRSNLNPKPFSQQGVCHTMALPFTLKCILRPKKNYENSNISPCKNIPNLQKKNL